MAVLAATGGILLLGEPPHATFLLRLNRGPRRNRARRDESVSTRRNVKCLDATPLPATETGRVLIGHGSSRAARTPLTRRAEDRTPREMSMPCPVYPSW